ncbi:hypothetical protein ANRL3_03090 [Anaerolineae bacterium]|nr:hypothetical protein ANRL3_03090 [Anaerolineae bacterium]
MPRAIHQILPFFAYGDAIGNQALELRRLIRELGIRSDIFAENWDWRLRRECLPYREYDFVSQPDNLLILHYSTSGQVVQYVSGLHDRVVLYYHNITPPDFFYWFNGELASELDEARQKLIAFAANVPAIAASPYNAQELQKLGFRVLGIAPYVLRLEQLDQGLAGRGAAEITQRYTDARMSDWLYVGRIAPNKCVHDVIKAFYYFHKWITTSSRLFLVGSAAGAEEYVKTLKQLIESLDLGHAVIFAGHFDASEGLGAFYQLANLYVSMSEHEGFCIPLLEAMHYQLPVMAYAVTGVPWTLGKAGVSITRKNYPMIAQVAYEVLTNAELKTNLLQRQHTRLADFAPARVRDQIRHCLEEALQMNLEK